MMNTKQFGKIGWNFPNGTTGTQRQRELIWAASDAIVRNPPRNGRTYEKGERLPVGVRRFIIFSHYRVAIARLGVK